MLPVLATQRQPVLNFFFANVCVYNLFKASALYSMGQTALALCSVH